MSGGHRAGPWQVAFTVAASLLLIFGVLYGINHQRTEGDRNAAGGTVTAQAPAENVAGSEAKDQQAQREGKGGAPAGQPETTGAGQQPEQASPEKAKPTTDGSQR